MRTISFIGAGRVGTALATALATNGFPVVAIASRNPASARIVARDIAGCEALGIQDAIDRADVVFLTVPDDSIADVASRFAWRGGQVVVHCSGATPVDALGAARDKGASVGGFHPLQIFSDRALAATMLSGCMVAVEGDDSVAKELHVFAKALGMETLTLPPGSRPLYHAGAGYAASFILSMLQEAVQLWQSFGATEEQALRALLPLSRGTLAAAASRGLSGALSGPISRGDVRVVESHLLALRGIGPRHVALYRFMVESQLVLAENGGTPEATLRALRNVVRDREGQVATSGTPES